MAFEIDRGRPHHCSSSWRGKRTLKGEEIRPRQLTEPGDLTLGGGPPGRCERDLLQAVAAKDEDYKVQIIIFLQ